MSEMKFYLCEHCGNIIGKIHDAGVPVVCCGQKMTQLIPGTVEASAEKHIPVPSVNGSVVKVAVGSVAHPVIEEHYIPWVYLQTTTGGQRKNLLPGVAPEVTFALTEGEEAVAVYAYCNLHGLWKAEI